MFKPFGERSRPTMQKVTKKIKGFYKEFVSAYPVFAKQPIFEVKDGIMFYFSSNHQVNYKFNAICLLGKKIAGKLPKEGRIKLTSDGGILTEDNKFLLQPLPRIKKTREPDRLDQKDAHNEGIRMWPYSLWRKPINSEDNKDSKDI